MLNKYKQILEIIEESKVEVPKVEKKQMAARRRLRKKLMKISKLCKEARFDLLHSAN